MKHSTKRPTKLEKEWMDFCTDFGCVVCHLQGRGYVPAAIHHILFAGLRMGHMNTIPLCDPGHHQNAAKYSGEVSRHPDKKAFEAKYTTEEWLHSFKQQQNQKLKGNE